MALDGAHRVALERLRAELAGTAAEQAAAREAREREERVEALAGKAMRRIQNAGIIAGWTAWQEQWATAAWQVRVRVRVRVGIGLGLGLRLAKPEP